MRCRITITESKTGPKIDIKVVGLPHRYTHVLLVARCKVPRETNLLRNCNFELLCIFFYPGNQETYIYSSTMLAARPNDTTLTSETSRRS
jgi:hypothetical protein